jgi:hypothetical protein
MLRKRILWIGAICLLVLGANTLSLWGQAVSTGTMAGTVTDNTGAVVVGATVSLTDQATNNTRTATTNADGHCIFQDLSPSTYNLTVSKEGFAQTTLSNL